MDSPYVNLNTITLYKTPMFNIVDSVMFSSKTERDNYFNSIPNTDKIEMTDFTDLFEGRSIVLPYNYLDLKTYNTMKLHYNDGLGHIEDYYCNVDNYLYISTDACLPIYRIDYFLTYSYMLYNKTIPMITERRTVSENSLTKNMKADNEAVPRLKYEKHPTYYTLPADTSKAPYYVVYLNKTHNNVGKLGINCKMQLYIGTDSSSNPYLYNIDTYTIGCYVAIADKDHLDSILSVEPLEYIEKIIEVDTLIEYLKSPDSVSLKSNGFVYLTQDIEIGVINDDHYMCKVNFYNEGTGLSDTSNFPRSERVNIYPNHKKKILDWQPTRGIVIQGFEFDIKDFDDNDFPSATGITKYDYLYSTIYFFNFLGYTFAYPLGYKHESVNMDFMIKWQSGRDFSYSSDYTNSLAYKELQEYNTQAVKYAKQQAGVQTYYNNQLLANTKKQIDVSKMQSLLSYQNQANSLNTSRYNLEEQYYSTSARVNAGLSLFGDIRNVFTLNWGQSDVANKIIEYEQAANNASLYKVQVENIYSQHQFNVKQLENQYEQMAINTSFQNDCIAIARDNTIANIAISNKYNNAKPNAYYETDFTQFSSYYYTYYIDTSYGDEIEQNIKNHYNVLGTYVGYLENWQPSVYEGLYFDYIKGSVINNSNEISKDIPAEVYINLMSRIESGVRIWHPTQLEWFGNLTIDNTNLGTAEPYNTYSDSLKNELQYNFNLEVYNNLEDKSTTLSYLIGYYTGLISSSYITWFVNNQPWGSETIPVSRQTQIITYWLFLRYDYSVAETKEIIKNADFLTIYEKQWALPQIT